MKPHLLLLLPALAFAWTPPDGELRASSDADLLRRSLSGSFYNEVWSFQFAFDDGTIGTLNFTYARLGIKGTVCGADLSLAGFRGANYTVGREYPSERFSQSASPFRIQIHSDKWIQGSPEQGMRVHFSTTKNQGFHLDLTFAPAKGGAVWGNGLFRMGDGRMTSAVAMAPTRFRGRLGVGSDTVEVTGTGILEHLRHDRLVSSLVNRSLRHLQGGDNPLYMHLFQDSEGRWGGYSLRWEGATPLLVPLRDVVVEGLEGREPPTSVRAGSGGTTIVWTRTGVRQRHSILRDLEGATRWIVRRLIGDVYIRRGQASTDLGQGIYQFQAVQ